MNCCVLKSVCSQVAVTELPGALHQTGILKVQVQKFVMETP